MSTPSSGGAPLDVPSSGVTSSDGRVVLKRAAVGSVCLLLGLLLFVSIEGRRPWHGLQLEYRGLQKQDLQGALEAEEQRLAPELDALRQDLEAKEAAWTAQRHEVHELQSQRRALETKRSLAQRRALASRRAYEDASRRQTGELGELRQAMDLDRREVEELGHQVEDRQAKIDALRADLTVAEEALRGVQKPLEDLRQELHEAALPSWADWPLLAPWVSSLRVMEQHPDVLETVQPPAVERCTTCHLGVLDTGASPGSRRPVLQPHPWPNLYLQPDSAHPLETFGCRVCHGGDGRATGGRRVTARGAEGDPHQGLLPRPLLGTACRACHEGVEDDGSIDPSADGADLDVSSVSNILAKGEGQLDLLGCASCHGESALERSAPDLTRLADKTSQGWVYAWLLDPAVGHPKLSSGGLQHIQAEAWAISESLWHRARPVSRPSPPRSDREVGGVLFETLGCRGCHPSESEDGIGPGLENGRRLDPNWTYAWLRRPRLVDPGTTMPDLRLSDDEAAGLTAFLTQDDADETQEMPVVDAALRDRLLLDALGENMTLRDAQARVDGLGDRQRTLALGDHLLASRGCFGCHRGGEASVASAGGLQGLSSASIPRLAKSHVPELATALGALLEEGAGLRGVSVAAPGPGPRYDLQEDVAQALLAALLDPPVQVADVYRPTSSTVIERGEGLVTRYGCRGCHRLGGRGGDAFATGDPLQRPPDLDGIGRKLRADWLQAYLEDPGRVTVRPWLRARMPTYGLSSEEVLDLVAFFLARDGASALYPTAETPRRQDLTVGSLLFEALQCDRCHFAAEDSGGFVLQELAPDYRLSAQRLRPDWMVQWLLDPQGERPRTTMPSFLGSVGEKDLGYLQRTFDSPLFLVHRQRLRRQFDDLEDMDAYLMDHQRVATALRDHVVSLGETSELR